MWPFLKKLTGWYQKAGLEQGFPLGIVLNETFCAKWTKTV